MARGKGKGNNSPRGPKPNPAKPGAGKNMGLGTKSKKTSGVDATGKKFSTESYDYTYRGWKDKKMAHKEAMKAEETARQANRQKTVRTGAVAGAGASSADSASRAMVNGVFDTPPTREEEQQGTPDSNGPNGGSGGGKGGSSIIG